MACPRRINMPRENPHNMGIIGLLILIAVLSPHMNRLSAHKPDQDEQFSHLPEWFHENDVGVIMPLGPVEEGKAIGFWAFGQATSQTCKSFPGGGFTLLHCFIEENPDAIIISSTLANKEYSFNTLSFHVSACMQSSVVPTTLKYSTTIVKKDPNVTVEIPYGTAHRMHCLNSGKKNGEEGRVLVLDAWRPIDEDTGCLITALTEVGMECPDKLTGQDCSVHVERDESGQGTLYIVLIGEGTVSVSTYNRIITLNCKHECETKVGDAKEVRVHCPSGSEHVLHAEEDLTQSCPFTQIWLVGNLASHICRTTFLPSLFWILLAWILLGKFFLVLSSYTTVALLSILATLIRKKAIQYDIEKGLCEYCKEVICGDSLISKHTKCSNGFCPYCDKKIGRPNLISHVSTCTLKTVLVEKVINQEISAFKSLARLTSVEKFFLSVKLNSGLYYLVTVMLLLILMSPVGMGQVVGPGLKRGAVSIRKSVNVSQPEETAYKPPEETIELPNFDNGMDIDDCYQSEGRLSKCAPMSSDFKPVQMISRPSVGVLKRFELEAEFCGTNCWSEETECNCPRKGAEEFFTDTKYSNSEAILDRHKRDIKSGKEVLYHPPSFYKGIFNRGRNIRPIRIGKKVITKSLIKDALGGKGGSDSERLVKPIVSERIMELSWSSYQKNKNKVLVKGNSIGVLDAKPHEGLIWKITSPDSNEKVELLLTIRDIAQVYKLESLFTTNDRVVQSHMRATCTGPCPEKCGLSRTPSDIENVLYIQNYPDSRHWTCNPTWCWSLRAGCTCCAAYVTPELNDWIVSMFRAKYMETEVEVCLQMSNKKSVCKTLHDTGKIELPNVKLEMTKAYGIDDKLPSKVGFVWYKKRSIGGNCDFIWLNPDVCESNCNHGMPGDYKCNEGLHNSGCSMTWKGIETSYSCHSGDWPTCNFHGLIKSNTEQFLKVNKTVEHASDNYILKSISDRGISVLPKSGGGMVQFSISVNGLELQRKEIKPEVSLFKVSECHGCFGCSSGFDCHVEIRSTSNMVFHINSKQGTLITNKQSLEPGEGTIKGYTLVNISEAEFCLEELPNICSSVKDLSLTKVDKILVEKDDLVTNIVTDKPDCKGLKWFSCFATTAGTFFKGIYNFLSSVLSNWREILMVIAFVVAACFLAYIFFLVCRLGRSRKSVSVNPAALMEELKKKREEMEEKELMKKEKLV